MELTPHHYQDDRVTLHHGDCLDVLAGLGADSVDAVVTDPPYGLEFMGKEWDKLGANIEATYDSAGGFGKGTHANAYAGARVRYGAAATKMQSFHEAWATAALRVLKPGGYLVAFGGTRTHHRLWCALEDAGFEIRDTLIWLYGSGFPKSLDVSKAIDKAAGAEREVVGANPNAGRQAIQSYKDDGRRSPKPLGDTPLTAPATDAARQWDGWGTALKPAWEPIVLARKPLVGTVAANVLAHGTGALNVDGCRVSGDGLHTVTQGGQRRQAFGMGRNQYDVPAGRWPANVVLDEEAAAMLDAQSGESISSGGRTVKRSGGGNVGSRKASEKSWSSDDPGYGDFGGASRFFYCAKASRAERGKGNAHPTVKPLALMRWLVRLVAPPGGLILDPFIGSGTTALAAAAEGFRCIGIDSNKEYLEMFAGRVAQPVLAAGRGD